MSKTRIAVWIISVAFLIASGVLWYVSGGKIVYSDACGCNQKCSCGAGGDKICRCGSITENSPSGRRCHIRCRCRGDGVCE